MKTYRFTRALDGAVIDSTREISIADARALLDSGALVEIGEPAAEPALLPPDGDTTPAPATDQTEITRLSVSAPLPTTRKRGTN